MRFPYRIYREYGDPPDAEVLPRPIVELRVIGRSDDAPIFGLLDTGADATMLDVEYIDLLDVYIKKGDHETFHGPSGKRFDVLYGVIDIELASRNRRTVYRWSARVGFMERPREPGAILGHEGFLEYFNASFHGPNRHVTLVPKAAQPIPCMPVE